MANMQTYHVDLSLDNSYVGTGTEDNKFSWGDVLRWFDALNMSPGDAGGTLDSGSPFDMSSLSVDFRMTGRKVMSATDVISVSGITFFLNASIRFTSHDPAKNGVATWTFPSNVSFTDFISVTGCSAPDIRVQGVLLRLEGTMSKLLNVEGTNGKAVFENNVAVLSTTTRICDLQADYGSLVIAGNTVIVRAIGGSQHILFSNNGASAKASVSHNLIGQVINSGSALVGLASLADGTVSASGNVWAIRPNGAPYTGVYPTASSNAPDVFGQLLSDVIYGDSSLDSTGTTYTSILDADTNNSRGCSEFTLAFARAKHTSGAISIIPAQTATATVGDPVGYIDILGRFRAGTVDAGAVQKSGLSYESTIHVDLSLPTLTRSNATGTEADPIGVADWQVDLVSRAPVDNNVIYAMHNSTGASVTPVGLKLGSGTGYVGKGSLNISGWKTFNRTMPALRVASIDMNQAINTKIEKIHLEWIGNDDLLSYAGTGISANEKKLQVVNTTIRSDIGNKGRLAVLSTQSPVLEMVGVSAALKHTSPVAKASGYIAVDSDLAHVIAISAFSCGNQATLMTVPAQTQINGIFARSTAGEMIVMGAATTDSVLLGAEPFVDTSASVPDFQLVVDSTAKDIVATEQGIPLSVRSLALTDCRGLERSAFPYGSTAYDAGAYEAGYKVYPEIHLYVDFSKASTGHVGSAVDKFSYADLVAWIASLKNETLKRKYVVHLLRRISMDGTVLDLSGIEGNPHCGGITFVTDSGKSASTVISGNAPTICANNVEGLSLDISKLLVGSSSGFGPIALSAKTGTVNKLTAKNSILAWNHTQVGFIVTRQGALGTTDFVSINTTSFNRSENSTDESADFAAIMQSIQDDELIGRLVRVEAITPGLSYRISPSTSVAITVNSSANITAQRASSLIDGDANWDVALGSVSIADVYNADLSLQTKVVGTSSVTFVSCAIEGTANGSSRISSVADNVDSITGLVYPNGATLGTVSGATVNARQTSMQIFRSATSNEFDQDDYRLVGAASTAAIISGAQFPAWGSDLSIDMNGALRFTLPTESVDAGAMEYDPIIPTGTYNPATQSPVVARTSLGQAMRLRAEADGPMSALNPLTGSYRAHSPFDFKIVGYQLLNAGYTYWQPTQPTEIEDFSGSQATAKIIVDAGNSFDATSVIEINYLGKVAKITYVPAVDSLAGFTAGATAADTANNIVDILRGAHIDNLPLESVMWASVTGSTITLTSKLIGSLGNTITVSATGAGLSSSDMAGGLDATAPGGQVYPASGWVPFDKNETPDPYSVSFALKLGVGQANTAFGSVVVIAQVTSSPLSLEVGSVFPFAVVRMPLESKHERKTISCRVLLT